ncbi:MAG: histidine kinase [Pedobacter sp.]|nr:MAG: histidine kinase [Pedobacter sp.]
MADIKKKDGRGTGSRGRSFLGNRAKRILIVVFAIALFYLVSFLLNPYDAFWQNYFERSPLDIVIEWLASFIFCFAISAASVFIHNRLNRTLPWTERPIRRLVVEALCNALVVMLLIFFNLLLIVYTEGLLSATLSVEEIRSLMQWAIVSLMISFMIISVNTGDYLISNWKNSEVKVAHHKLREAELRQASTEAELTALKLQLDPHFIFNSLGILSELILEDQQLGYEYSERFAKVYRYLLVNSKKNVVRLDEELKFLESYIFLIQHRIGTGVVFEMSIDTPSRQLYLPPLTLQLLIENALKHNSTHRNNPLCIKLQSKDRQLTVENSIVPLTGSQAVSAGIGLANIAGRFALLMGRAPEVIQDETTFKVNIYLMEYDQ